MTERAPERGGGGEGPGPTRPRLLFIVARGQDGLRAAIEHVLRGVPEVEVIENRRGDGILLPHSKQEVQEDTALPPGDQGDGSAVRRDDGSPGTNGGDAWAPRTAWSIPLPRRAWRARGLRC